MAVVAIAVFFLARWRRDHERPRGEDQGFEDGLAGWLFTRMAMWTLAWILFLLMVFWFLVWVLTSGETR